MGKEKYITYSKAIAAISVVLYHTWGSMSINPEVLGKILLFFYTTHVPTFMLISGYLYSKYTVRHELKYRVYKLLNLFLSFIAYIFILSLFRIVLYSIGDSGKSLKEIFVLTAHNMWYFPVLCISIVLLEIIRKLDKGRVVVFLSAILILSFTDIILLYKLPSVGKILVYIMIFLIGTLWSIDRNKAISCISINMVMWLFFVFFFNIVDISSEGSSGLELCFMMLMTVCGASLIPAIVFLVINSSKSKEANINALDRVLSVICKNTQLIYFFQFFIIIIVEFLRDKEIVECSVINCLLYSLLCFSFALIMSNNVSKKSWLSRIFLSPITYHY